jgi:hypothetical protein
MAGIDITLQRAEVEVSPFHPWNPCLGIKVSVDPPPVKEGGGPIPYARDFLSLHGSADELRAFADKIIASLDAEAVSLPQPVASILNDSPDIDSEVKR